MPQLLTVAAALQLIESRATALAPQAVPLSEAVGLLLAEDVASDIDSPPHDKAMMDGYAVRSEDDDPLRRVVEEVFAGDVPTANVGPGEATRIMTGAPLPTGADAVTPVEQTERVGDDQVRLLAPQIQAGKHVMPRGQAMRAGDVVLGRGTMIRPAEVALLAEVGCDPAPVTPRPRVAILPTGNELAPASQQPGPGQIRNSNGPMLAAAVAEAGATPCDAGVAMDDAASLRQAILAARDAQVLLLSGGVSAGDRDLAPGILAELGVEKVLHKVAVKPGKPVWFGVWPPEQSMGAATYVFGLPGNPVSSFVCFELFVRPLLGQLAGRGFEGLAQRPAVLGADLDHRGGRETYLPAHCEPGPDGGLSVQPVRWRGSADLAGLARANCLLKLPAEPISLAAGDSGRVLLL